LVEEQKKRGLSERPIENRSVAEKRGVRGKSEALGVWKGTPSCEARSRKKSFLKASFRSREKKDIESGRGGRKGVGALTEEAAVG